MVLFMVIFFKHLPMWGIFKNVPPLECLVVENIVYFCITLHKKIKIQVLLV